MVEKSETLEKIEQMSRKKFERLCIECLENMGFRISDIKSVSGDMLAEGTVEREGEVKDYIIKVTRSGGDTAVEAEGVKNLLTPKTDGLLITTDEVEKDFFDSGNIEVAGGDKFFRLLKKFDLLSKFNLKGMEEDESARQKELVEKGDREFSKDNFREALNYYTEAISAGDESPVPYLKKGRVLLETGKVERAIEALRDSTEIDRENPEAWTLLGEALYLKDEREKAVEAYDEALDIDEDYLKAWKKKGKVLYDLETYDEALRCFEKILEIEPKSKETWNNKGLCYMQKSELKKSLDSLNSALSLDPDFEEALLNKALVFEKMEKLEKAVKVSEDLIEHFPEKAEYHYIKGAYLTELGEREEALESINRCLELDPNHDKAKEMQLFLEGKLEKDRIGK